MIRVGFLLVIAATVCCVHGQIPFGRGGFMDGFFQNMENMMGNIQRMSSEQMRRASSMGAGLGPGQRRFYNNGNSRGYAYRSPDGGSYSYTFSSGGPGSSGYMYHSGPDGTYERRW